MSIPFLDFKRMHAPIRSELVHCFESILDESRFVNSLEVQNFEKEFAEYCHSPHVLGISSGLDALILGLKALGLEKNEKVLAPAMTFTATVEAIVHAGGEPVLVDVDSRGLIDLNQVETHLKNGVKWMMPVHLFGQLVNPHDMLALQKKYGVKIIEDACQAHGATIDNYCAGSIGDAAAFSFYPGKNLGALGDGGALAIKDEKVKKIAAAMREHGQPQKNVFDYIGYTFRLDNLQAGLLSIKLKHLNAWTEDRKEIAKKYQARLGDFELQCKKSATPNEHVYHLFVALVDHREKYLAALTENKIGYGMHYPISLNNMPCYKKYNWYQKSFPLAEKYAAKCVSLPIYPHLRDDEISKVCDVMLSVRKTL